MGELNLLLVKRRPVPGDKKLVAENRPLKPRSKFKVAEITYSYCLRTTTTQTQQTTDGEKAHRGGLGDGRDGDAVLRAQ